MKHSSQNNYTGKNNKDYKKNSDFGNYKNNTNRSEKKERFANNSKYAKHSWHETYSVTKPSNASAGAAISIAASIAHSTVTIAFTNVVDHYLQQASVSEVNCRCAVDFVVVLGMRQFVPQLQDLAGDTSRSSALRQAAQTAHQRLVGENPRMASLLTADPGSAYSVPDSERQEIRGLLRKHLVLVDLDKKIHQALAMPKHHLPLQCYPGQCLNRCATTRMRRCCCTAAL